MRILVVSDTHGNAQALRQAVLAQPRAGAVVHLGDGMREAQDVADEFAQLPFYLVRGNCDWGAVGGNVPVTRLETLGGKRIFCTHGHAYEVKFGLYRAVMAARENRADVLLYGHTHQAFTDYEDGLYILNPGSLSRGGRPSYGLLDITPQGIVPHIVEVDG